VSVHCKGENIHKPVHHLYSCLIHVVLELQCPAFKNNIGNSFSRYVSLVGANGFRTGFKMDRMEKWKGVGRWKLQIAGFGLFMRTC